MRNRVGYLTMILALVVALSSCNEDEAWTTWSAHPETCPCDGSDCGEEGEGEHGEGNHEEEGEESGTQYGQDEMLDETYQGARLILSYDVETDLFTGTVENTTGTTLCDVRVEVHLNNGRELGPTDPIDLLAGESIDVELSPEEAHDGEGEGEHD